MQKNKTVTFSSPSQDTDEKKKSNVKMKDIDFSSLNEAMEIVEEEKKKVKEAKAAKKKEQTVKNESSGCGCGW